VAEGNRGTKVAVFVITMSVPTTRAVTVRFATADGTAVAGRDYLARGGRVTFAPGETTKRIGVAVRGDRAVEGHETFRLALSAAVNATAGQARATGTIGNDDRTSRAAVSWSRRHTGGTRYALSATIRNPGPTALNGWTLELDLDADITGPWNAVVVRRAGNNYTIRPTARARAVAANGGGSRSASWRPQAGRTPCRVI
jgi:hypothetical protein